LPHGLLEPFRSAGAVVKPWTTDVDASRNGGSAGTAPRVRVHHASQVVGMDEAPSKALRGKKDSSMRVAIDLVKSGGRRLRQCRQHRCADGDGALRAQDPAAGRPPGHHQRHAVGGGRTHMLDLGANVDCSAEHLFQFAVMGSELVRAVQGIERPTVGLLNIGEEEIKGNDQVRRAHELIPPVR
jgi:glycerol-3-phosphate acyltransferase PlsX